MAYPALIDVVLIVSICGLIAICVYSLQLEDKLLSRIEKLEGEISKPQAAEKTPESVSRLSIHSDSGSETLYAVRNDEDLDHARESASNFPPVTPNFEMTASEKSDRGESTTSNLERISQATKKIEPVEEDTFEWPQDEF